MIAVEMVGGPQDGERRVFHDDEQIVFVYRVPVPPVKVPEPHEDPAASIEVQTIQYLRYPKPDGWTQGLPLYRARFVPGPS